MVNKELLNKIVSDHVQKKTGGDFNKVMNGSFEINVNEQQMGQLLFGEKCSFKTLPKGSLKKMRGAERAHHVHHPHRVPGYKPPKPKKEVKKAEPKPKPKKQPNKKVNKSKKSSR